MSKLQDRPMAPTKNYQVPSAGHLYGRKKENYIKKKESKHLY